jgi:hypothetical protein
VRSAASTRSRSCRTTPCPRTSRSRSSRPSSSGSSREAQGRGARASWISAAKPLIDPLTLCGTQFPGLRVKRHRLFESNVPLTAPKPHPKGKHPLHYTLDKRKAHYGRLDEWTAFVQVTGGGNCSKAAAADAMGVRRHVTKDELNQGVPPLYTEHVGRQLVAHLAASADRASP